MVDVAAPNQIPSPPPEVEPPDWQHCAVGADSSDPVGCRGLALAPHGRCLTHADSSQKDAFLASLSPGGNLDLRGTTVSEQLLDEVLHRFYDPTRQHKRFGDVDLTEAVIDGNANYGHSHFEGTAVFFMATFQDGAKFNDAVFNAYVSFENAILKDAFFGRADFRDEAFFDGAHFERTAGFGLTVFSGATHFTDCTFHSAAFFSRATFRGPLEFWQSTIGGDIDFSNATFSNAPQIGPLICAQTVNLTLAVFEKPTLLEVSARQVDCQRTHWKSTATLRLRYAAVNLDDAFFEYPVAVTSRERRFVSEHGTELSEDFFDGLHPTVRMTTVRGVDAAHLVLTDLDLSSCIFTGAFHLDQIRMEGNCTYSATPTGFQRNSFRLARWTQRRTIYEEHLWRMSYRRAESPIWRGWTTAGQDITPPTPSALGATYRQLRKALEDGKNEPDAADFYYGEMEMRRHDPSRPFGERVLLSLYWGTSGYGLRASRALGWLLLTMIATVASLTIWGIPKSSVDSSSSGQIKDGSISITTEKPDPANPEVPYRARITGKRVESALRVTLNSVIFRSSGQDLTKAGTYIEMASRFSEPVLLGLAVLAIRGRVKR
ncbi:pentapeptide repeat-containing protein [Streptomyces sp. XY006]|uniref:pentapeptide repeat-containing protein n=1 Tax=Streptomyces sp. XY006 TaxID=2021410 RepID=UPI0015C68F9A|nr:pentapeptide repeat-containing protein [Streptomyces sp. XY006]